jgi:pyruvate kinase
MKKQKIIVTLGPATNNEEMLLRIKEAHVDFVRLNMSHASLEELESTLALSKKLGMTFVLDTEGPQIRTGKIKDSKAVLGEGDEIKIYGAEIEGDNKNICIKPGSVLKELQVGDLMALDFNTALIKVSDVSGLNEGFVDCKVVSGGTLGSNKAAVIFPRVEREFNLPPLSEKDIKAIEIALKHNVGYIAASFIRDSSDINEIRNKTFGKMKIISKVETAESIKNLDEVIINSDYILIDRGDLSKHIPWEKVPLTQKIILDKSKKMNVPAFVATNFLESMLESSKPTRAEVNDIMNTLLDGAYGLALCTETAIGKYPIEAINVLNKIINHASSIFGSELSYSESEDIFRRLEETDYLKNNSVGSSLILPHGGKLVSRVLKNPMQEKEFCYLKRISIDLNKYMDLQQIAVGTFSPLEGFMIQEELKSVLDFMRLPSGVVWTVPIIFDIPKEDSEKINTGQTMALDYGGEIVGLLHVEEKYHLDKQNLIKKLFGTEEVSHPGVTYVQNLGEVLLGGKVELIKNIKSDFEEYELTPRQVRRMFEEKGWSKVVGFHTRNAVHKAHEFLQLDALKKYNLDGIFIHPIIGSKKKGDFTSKIIIKSYEKMKEKFYPKNNVLLAVFSTFSRYAGPREAIFTAICRKNFGCSHFIVGRDHTGVGNFYLPDASHKIFDNFPDLGIIPIKYGPIFYSKKHLKYLPEEELSNLPDEEKLSISGTEARKMLESLNPPPEWFMRPEISEMIINEIKKGSEVFVK